MTTGARSAICRRRSQRATRGTPYTVSGTDAGFDVELDVANGQWWELFGRAGLQRAFRWVVVVSVAMKKSPLVARWRSPVLAR